MVKKCFIICWFGKFPEYFPQWVVSCSFNKSYDFLIFTDQEYSEPIPDNIKLIPLTLDEFKNKAETVLEIKCDIKKPYRICDFRPMFGLIFKDEISDYDFWGYCDIDLIFGNLENFILDDDFAKFSAFFNGGPFTLIKNNNYMNNLFKLKGSAFNYKKVISHDAIFAFDEVTGIQQIARNNNVNAKFLVPCIETDTRHLQLRSRFDIFNPNVQAFYWENGNLFRVAQIGKKIMYQDYAYIHLQKRKVEMLSSKNNMKESFWITPKGFLEKNKTGQPILEDIERFNPYNGNKMLKKEKKNYKIKKLKLILSRNPFQIYVRIKQARFHINRFDSIQLEYEWKNYM